MSIVEGEEAEFGDSMTATTMSSKEIYQRIASHLVLLSLYCRVNEAIIEERTGLSAIFRRHTATLKEIITVMDRIELKLNFQHIWFPAGKFTSFWAFFNRVE